MNDADENLMNQSKHEQVQTVQGSAKQFASHMDL